MQEQLIIKFGEFGEFDEFEKCSPVVILKKC